MWLGLERDPAPNALRRPNRASHSTSIPGLFSCGGCDGTSRGASRLGANSLLSASYSGRVVGESVAAYVKGLKDSCEESPEEIFTEEKKRQDGINQSILAGGGDENPFLLHKELGDMMRARASIVRTNEGLDEALAKIGELKERFAKITLDDTRGWSNQPLSHARQVHDMIVLAEVITRGARQRDECRGSHWKPEFELPIPEGKFPGDPEFEEYREKWKINNEQWLKTTVAEHSESGPVISYEDVDTSLLPVDKPRDYR